MSGEQTGSGAPPASPLGGLGMIWAQDRTGLLGARGEMLWRVPADFMHFKAATMGAATPSSAKLEVVSFSATSTSTVVASQLI